MNLLFGVGAARVFGLCLVRKGGVETAPFEPHRGSL